MIRPWLIAFAVGTASTLANALPLAHCVVARKPTREQMKDNRTTVEHLLDEYDGAARTNGAWAVALKNVHDAFPVPTVNLQIAQHHSEWTLPERKLVAYVEAARQDPTFYADPEAIRQKIKDAELHLIPNAQRAPILVVEARGIVRRQNIDSLSIQLNGHPCNGDLVEDSAETEISWMAKGTRVSATFASEQIQEGRTWCVALEDGELHPCNPSLDPDPQTEPPPALPTQPAVSAEPPAPELSAAIPWTPPPPPPDGPAIDYTVATIGGSIAVAGFIAAAWADGKADSYFNSATCDQKQCGRAAASKMEHAIDYRNTYFVSTAVGFAGIAVLLISPYRYYRAWFSPKSGISNQHLSALVPDFAPSVLPAGAGVTVQGRF
ncbi:MAG TPA: hypothetical protein VKP30_13265 [Polyangiaceae bacterium]|nr:hypothetical protein [Polyangiaceae bacterium]